MSEEFNLKIKLPPYVIYSIFTVIVIIISLFLSFFVVPEGSFLIIKETIGDKYSLASLSLVTLVICGINLILSWNLYKKDRMASHILGALSVFVSIVILLKVTTIIFTL